MGVQIDYEDLKKAAGEISTIYGKTINNDFNKVYQKIIDLHSIWEGDRYEKIARGYNEVITGVNNLLKFVRFTLPTAINDTARNYATVDIADSFGNATIEQVSAMPTIDYTTAPQGHIKYDIPGIQETKVNVDNALEDAIRQVEQAEVRLKRVVWTSEKGEATRQEMAKIKSNLIAEINEFKTSFDKNIDNTIADFTSAEK